MDNIVTHIGVYILPNMEIIYKLWTLTVHRQVCPSNVYLSLILDMSRLKGPMHEISYN
jgi:hypothetical protein